MTRTFYAAARRVAGRLGLHVGRKAYFDLIRRDYYSPIPDLRALPDQVWDERTALGGIAFDTGRQIAWGERELGEHIRRFEAPALPERDGFHFENGTYEHGDAEIAYAVLRRFRPSRVLELGSGYSTLALEKAVAANALEGTTTSLVANDPFPTIALEVGGERHYDLLRRQAQDIPLSEFRALGRNDVLFVDTTHVVKMGGDVNYVILEVLPALAPGVIVHFHDIWLPDQYHRALTEVHGNYWTEQYLLQAFLAFNAEFEVMFANHAVARYEAERFTALVPGYTGRNFPSGFWLRRVAPEARGSTANAL